jgi:hypothetical protein
MHGQPDMKKRITFGYNSTFRNLMEMVQYKFQCRMEGVNKKMAENFVNISKSTRIKGGLTGCDVD